MSRITIKKASLEDMEQLILWREEVIRDVFAIPAGSDIGALMEANRSYYLRTIPTGEHIACFALKDGEASGCGGICFQREMPSPDNFSGVCAYLMNIYVRQPFRVHHVGQKIVKWLVGRAVGIGAGKIYLESTESGRPLYKGLHFQDMNDMMKLPQPAPWRTLTT